MKRAIALLMSLAIIISLCPAIVTSANTGTGSSKIDLSAVAATAATSNHSLEGAPHGISVLLDGNRDTTAAGGRYIGWPTGATGTDPFQETWIVVDLQKVYTIDKYGFCSWGYGFEWGVPKDFTIQVSLDGNEYTTVYTREDMPVTDVTENNWFGFTFTAVDARYVKLNVTELMAAADCGNFVCLTEIEIYGTEKQDTPPAQTGEKIDLTGYVEGMTVIQNFPQSVATASASYENWGIGLAALLDDNVSTRYAGVNEPNAPAAEFTPTWVQLDLQKVYTIDKVEFNSFANGTMQGLPTAFTIQVSTNGTDWTTVHTETNLALTTVPDSSLYSFAFAAVDARYVKLDVTAIGGAVDTGLGTCLCLTELDVYGYEKQDTPPAPPAQTGEKIDLSAVASTAVTANPSLELWTFAVAHLLDNDIGTLFCGNVGSSVVDTFTQTWIQVDLQKAYMVDKVSFDSYAAGDQGRPSNIDLEISVDGQTWIKILDDHNVPLTTVADSTYYEFSFEAKEARYVKLTVNAVAANYDLGQCVCLRGLDVYGYEEQDTPPAQTGEKIDLSGYVAGLAPDNASNFNQPVVTVSDSYESYGHGMAWLIDGIETGSYRFFSVSEANYVQGAEFGGAWIQLDLQKVYTVDKFSFNTFQNGTLAGAPSAFTIEVSTDGQSWTKVYEETNMPLTAVPDSNYYEFAFTATDARYVKLNVTAIGAPSDIGNYVCLGEISAYGTEKADTPPVEEDQVPTGDKIEINAGNVAVSGEYKPDMGKDNLFDGKLDTAWGAVDANKAPAQRMDEWFQLDLQQEYSVNKIRLANRSDAVPLGGLPNVFDVMVSTDGKDWKVVKSVNGISEGDITDLHWLTVEFEATTARYVRVRVYDLAAVGEAVIGYVVCLREFEVYTAEGKIDLSSYAPDLDTWDGHSGGPMKYFASNYPQNVASASTSYELWGWGVAGLIDGNVESDGIFALAPNSDAALPVGGLTNVITIDMKAAYKLDALRFASLLANSLNGLPAEFKLEVSLHGTTWTTVLTKTNMGLDAADKDGQWYTFLFDPTESIRFIRLTITEVGADASPELGYCAALSELELYGEADPSTVIKPDGWGKINLSNAVVRATNSYNLWGHGTGNLYNGNQTNSWCILTSEEEADFYQRFKDEREFTNECDEFIKIRLNGIYEIDLMRFESVWAGSGLGVPNKYKLEVSMDGKTWTTAMEVDGKQVSSTRWYSDDIAPVQARYLRLSFENVIAAGDLGYVPHLTELEFYGILISEDEVDMDVPAPKPPALPDLAPETGDETSFILPAMLITASVLALAVLVIERRKFMR